MKLVIAEKPSVGVSIAKILGAKTRKDGFFEGNGYVVSWCVGHLVSQEYPEAYDEKYKNRNIEHLPIFPKKWKYKITDSTSAQFYILDNLINRDDVTELVCATDAGREGEHIFRLVYLMSGSSKPFTRLWTSSLEVPVIEAGFNNLLPGSDKDTLAAAAMCRSQADWLVGINMSRLFTTPIGRVQTPTLALVVNRENAIKGFTEEYSYKIVMQNEKIMLSSEKIDNEDEAKNTLEILQDKPAQIIKVEEKEGKTNPPKLYDLTLLQREASRMFGFTAKDTLNMLQNLYESKLVTYPRTDSSYLTEEMKQSTEILVDELLNHSEYKRFKADSINIDRVIDSSKVSDHHAVIPTLEILKADLSKLKADELKILNMVTARLFIATAPPEVSKNITLEAVIDGNSMLFKFSSKTVIDYGYKLLEREFKSLVKAKENKTDKEDIKKNYDLSVFKENDTISDLKGSIEKITSSPPAHFTEDTLLGAMERAGNEDYEDDETEKKGIGTPATMASIIDGLINQNKFLERKGKQIIPTQRGHNLIKLLPQTLTSPSMTAQWETMLQKIEKGEETPDKFMQNIKDFVCLHIAEFDELTDEQKALIPTNPAFEKQILCNCPRCGSPVHFGKNNYYCSKKECGLFMMKQPMFFEKSKKKLTEKMAKTLFEKGEIDVKGLYSAKKDKTYDATVLLVDPGDGFLSFKLEFSKPKK